MPWFLSKGYRVIAHDRRGHGRSSQTVTGHDMDTHVAGVVALADALDLKETRPGLVEHGSVIRPALLVCGRQIPTLSPLPWGPFGDHTVLPTLNSTLADARQGFAGSNPVVPTGFTAGRRPSSR